jgi:putative Holliday junction resolvase
VSSGRVLGLDYGTRRIGVALSDPLRLTAGPLTVLDAAGDVASELRLLVAEHDVSLIVVGLPVGLDGTEGKAAAAARDFAGRVGATLGVPVELYDERFSSVTAERTLIEAGMRRERRKGTRDRVAAAVFLQAYLDGRS